MRLATLFGTTKQCEVCQLSKNLTSKTVDCGNEEKNVPVPTSTCAAQVLTKQGWINASKDKNATIQQSILYAQRATELKD